MYKKQSLITQERMKVRHWYFDWSLSGSWKVLAETLVIFQLFVLFLLISEKEHKYIVYV